MPALITDGVVRDLEGVLGTGLPVWCDGYAAPPSVAGLTFVGWGEPIGCGGVAIFPDDVIVADQDGAVVIPKAFLDHVLAEGAEQERMEGWIVEQVNNGAVLPGPLSDECRDQGALRGIEEITKQAGREHPWISISPVHGRPAARRRNSSPARYGRTRSSDAGAGADWSPAAFHSNRAREPTGIPIRLGKRYM